MNKLQGLRKTLAKKDFNLSLNKPDHWLCLGNMSLNYICTGRLRVGVPNRRVVMAHGPSGTGKSLIAGHVAKSAQLSGYQVIYIDTEDAIDPEYLTRIGVDIEDEELFLPIRISTVEELVDVTAEIFRMMTTTDKFCVIVDSLGMLETEDHAEAFEKKGELKNDMGLFAKRIKKYLKNITSKVGEYDCFFYVNQHSYQNQDVTNGRGTHVASGGEAQVYIPSITLLLKKLKLKEGSKVTGVKIKASTDKTRFTQTGLSCEIEVPYKTGIDPYSGVLEILEENGILEKSGAWYSFTLGDEIVKFQKSKFSEYAELLIDRFESSLDDEIVEMPEEVAEETE